MNPADQVHRMLVDAVRGAVPTYDAALAFTVDDDGDGRGIDVRQMVRGARWTFDAIRDDGGASANQRRMRADLRLDIYYPEEMDREPARAQMRAAADAELLNRVVAHPDMAGWSKPILTVETEDHEITQLDGDLRLTMNFYALYLGES